MKSNIVETIAGAFVLLVSLLILIYAYAREHASESKGYNVQAQFERADGLVEGSDVKLGGIKIGKVTHLTLDPKTFYAIAQISLDDHVKLPTDSSATITSESLLGGKYLDIVPGGDDTNLAPGDRIKHTQSAVNIEQLIGQAIFNKDEKKSA